MTLSAALDKSSPVVTEVTSGAYGVIITWTANSGVFKYTIFRKEVGGKYTKLVETTGSGTEGVKAVAGSTCSYVDGTATAGTTYVYTVRGMDASGKYVTSYDTNGVSATAE